MKRLVAIDEPHPLKFLSAIFGVAESSYEIPRGNPLGLPLISARIGIRRYPYPEKSCLHSAMPNFSAIIQVICLDT
jgi:hypothetical protein